MFKTASSSGNSSGVPARIACANASPCSVYWFEISRLSICAEPSPGWLPSSMKIRQGRSAGALNGISTSIRALVPKIWMRW
jgi:hypothetical protein